MFASQRSETVLGLSSCNIVLLFYPLCEVSGSFSQKCSFLAQHHQIPSTRDDLLNYSVAQANPLVLLHFQSPLQRGMEVQTNKLRISVWKHVYAQFQQILQSKTPFGLPQPLSNMFCADHITCCRHLLPLRVPPRIPLQMSELTSLFPVSASNVRGHINNLPQVGDHGFTQ